MAKTFILGSNTATSWAKDLGCIVTVPTIAINNYEEIHNFVCREFAGKQQDDKVVIDLDAINPALALLVALHIRLSVSYIKAAAFVPLLFVSKLPLQSFLKYGECSQLFLMSRGTYFCTPEETTDALEIIEGLSVENFKSDFLCQIHISPDAEIGRHSMANQWGADVFNRIISKDDRNETEEIKSAKKKLYYKYVFLNTTDIKATINDIENDGERENVRLNATGKNILLIDDEADKGWSFVLKDKFFVNSNFDVINSAIADYDDIPETIRQKIESDYYDLYLLDLRLLGTKEDEIYSADEFSGMKILKEIKNKNQGNQVVILTASNKAWNMKALLDAGADGYYIKESPELQLPISFSNANFQAFKDAVEISLNSGYKREIYRGTTKLLFYIQQSTLIQNDIEFADDLQSTLKSAQRQISTIVSKEDFAFAYITLFQLLEIISRHFIVETNNGWNLPMYNYDYFGNAGNAITKADTKNPPILSKLVAIYEMNNSQAHNNHFLVKKIDDCIKRRHSFVHHLKELHLTKNQTIFAKEGIISLWEIVNKIINSIV
ncbi:MAG: hypothetical protein II852_01280 [Bacteroidales bacterium]|nr:hypothetical protein [Bacteroidales bacterium]